MGRPAMAKPSARAADHGHIPSKGGRLRPRLRGKPLAKGDTATRGQAARGDCPQCARKGRSPTASPQGAAAASVVKARRARVFIEKDDSAPQNLRNSNSNFESALNNSRNFEDCPLIQNYENTFDNTENSEQVLTRSWCCDKRAMHRSGREEGGYCEKVWMGPTVGGQMWEIAGAKSMAEEVVVVGLSSQLRKRETVIGKEQRGTEMAVRDCCGRGWQRHAGNGAHCG
ncbi:hypothetical protein BHE74_00046707 [Ensete ventricosum]|nr:hypothetical protein BHE74_00046707 [Ensete ventricosum]